MNQSGRRNVPSLQEHIKGKCSKFMKLSSFLGMHTRQHSLVRNHFCGESGRTSAHYPFQNILETKYSKKCPIGPETSLCKSLITLKTKSLPLQTPVVPKTHILLGVSVSNISVHLGTKKKEPYDFNQQPLLVTHRF